MNTRNVITVFVLNMSVLLSCVVRIYSSSLVNAYFDVG